MPTSPFAFLRDAGLRDALIAGARDVIAELRLPITHDQIGAVSAVGGITGHVCEVLS